ncbi:hypothetical protein RHECIAT_CH0002211 [Rhizobium etli CIAT 652]|uniref:Cation efflux protein transmembrane domain-containing protein n=1 Tax=Rhizobium etli (strain CIAT 652) TaxID=491916 RepID=B3Q0G4_RHIE6|nr:hypothetical protein RHECIAT_CH0002211 [Rhizobium etli CIAT 652]
MFLFCSICQAASIFDVAHMMTDVVALAIALMAIKVGNKPADERGTYGYKEAQNPRGSVQRGSPLRRRNLRARRGDDRKEAWNETARRKAHRAWERVPSKCHFNFEY